MLTVHPAEQKRKKISIAKENGVHERLNERLYA